MPHWTSSTRNDFEWKINYDWSNDVKMTIWEIRKHKNENKKKTEEAKNKDSRELLLKEKLFKDISSLVVSRSG